MDSSRLGELKYAFFSSTGRKIAGPDEVPESSQHCRSTENHVDIPPAEVTLTLQEQVYNVRLAMLVIAPEPMVVTHQYMTWKQWKTFAKKWCSTLFKTILDMLTPTRCHRRAETTTNTDEAKKKKHSVVVIHD